MDFPKLQDGWRQAIEPYPGASDLNVTSALEKQKYDPIRITQSAENFYVSLGFPKLPQTFWQRSLFPVVHSPVPISPGAVRAAGRQGPLHECSVYGNEEAGRRLREMLALGRSQPWRDTLENLTGTRQMDASAITAYFAPLLAWLEGQNKDQQCGW